MKARARPIHFEVTAVHANDGCKSVARSSAYIRRCNVRDEGSSLLDTDAYVRRAREQDWNSQEVAESRFFCRGSHTRENVWGAVDRAFRTKTGKYSRRGGHSPGKGKKRAKWGTPRLALFIDATLPLDISEDRKIAIGVEMAEALVDQYGCAVEVAWHVKNGVIDHVHLLVSTRRVDEDGVGRIIREFNGIAGKYGEKAVREGDLRLPPDIEWMRSTFAAMLTRETGYPYDPRSYARQKNGITPVSYVSRKRIEDEERAGTNGWREERQGIIAARAIFAGYIEKPIEVPFDLREGRHSAAASKPAIGTEGAVTDTLPASDVKSSGHSIDRSGADAARNAGISKPKSEKQPAMTSTPVSGIAGLVGLAVPVEHRVRASEQHAAFTGRRIERMDPDNLVAEQWREVDEQNRRETGADLAKRNAEREASAQKPAQNPNQGFFPPPTDRKPAGLATNDGSRRAALEMARAIDRLALRRDGPASRDTVTNPEANASATLSEPASRRDAAAVRARASTPHAPPATKEEPALPPTVPPVVVEPGRLAASSPTSALRPAKETPETTGDSASYAIARVKAKLGNSALPQGSTSKQPIKTVTPDIRATVQDGAGESLFIDRASDLSRQQQAKATSESTRPKALPAAVPPAPNADHHIHTFGLSPKRRKPRAVSADLLVRLATALQSYGGLAVHAEWLTELSGMDRAAFNHEVAIQSQAYAMRRTLPRELKMQLLAEIEAGGHSTVLAAAVDALTRKATAMSKTTLRQSAFARREAHEPKR